VKGEIIEKKCLPIMHILGMEHASVRNKKPTKKRPSSRAIYSRNHRGENLKAF